MSTVEVTYYQVKCDCCGTVCDDYGDFSALSEPEHAQSQMPEDWAAIAVGGSNIVEHLCSECWCWPGDHPEHLGDDNWTGSDDAIRKHALHPGAVTELIGTITIPRPHIPFGPTSLSENEADAYYLRDAAEKLETFYKPFGSNPRATVVKLLRDAAEAVSA